MVISWKKSDGQGGPLQYLATGTHRLTSDTRVSVEEANEHGSTLVISFANDQDVGDYVCEVSSNPPATLRHHVSLIGNMTNFWPSLFSVRIMMQVAVYYRLHIVLHYLRCTYISCSKKI